MNILTVCYYGKNRSKYLAEFLEKKGYVVKYAGVADDATNKLKQHNIDEADIIIFVEDRVEKRFLKRYKLAGQKTITLSVDDRPEIVAPKKVIKSTEDWLVVQESLVYPELKRQIEKYLPF